MHFYRLLILSTLLFILGSCSSAHNKSSSTSSSEDQNSDLQVSEDKFHLTQNFHQFANEKWGEKQKIPAWESEWNKYKEVENQWNQTIYTMMNSARNTNSSYSAQYTMMADYYQALTNREAKERLTSRKTSEIIKKNESIMKVSDLNRTSLEMVINGISTFYGIDIKRDLDNPEVYGMFIKPDGLGLPAPEFYIASEYSKIQELYTQSITNVFDLLGYSDADKQAESVYNFELLLAKLQESESTQTITSMPTKEFEKSFPYLNIQKLVRKTEIDVIHIENINYFKDLANVLKEYDIEIIKNYIIWKQIQHYQLYLDDSFVSNYFYLNPSYKNKARTIKKPKEDAQDGTIVISEIKTQRIRSLKVDSNLFINELKNNLLVNILNHQPLLLESTKEMTDGIFKDIQKATLDLIQENSWLNSEDKAQVLLALNSVEIQYSGSFLFKSMEELKDLRISNNNPLSNLDNCNRFFVQNQLAKIGKPVDNIPEIPMYSPTLEYDSYNHKLTVSTGLLVDPFFTTSGHPSINYGGIGMIFARELLTNIIPWENYLIHKKSASFNESYSKTKHVFESTCEQKDCINLDYVSSSLGEIGAVKASLNAYQKTKAFKKDKSKGEYSPTQQFFIAYAQLSGAKYSFIPKGIRRNGILELPVQNKVNGVLMNLSEFHSAFNIKNTDKMWVDSKDSPHLW